MKNEKNIRLFLSLGMMALSVCGCATKKVETTEVPKAPLVQEAPKEEAVPRVKYVVKKGDTLWAISNQGENYSDSFQWPLIFKSNRDQIQDPDQISPGQVLFIQKGSSKEQTNHARQLASDTPKFVTHDDPRATLPLDYFN